MGILDILFFGRSNEIANEIDKAVASEAAALQARKNLTERIIRRGNEIAQDIRDDAASDRRHRGNYLHR